jgi:hypothetical protein
MAFGMLVNKWRIFTSPLLHPTVKASAIVMCAMKLHNFCIRARLSINQTTDIDLAPDDAPDVEASENERNPNLLGYLPSTSNSLPPRRGNTDTHTCNIVRIQILRAIKHLDLQVPSHNRKRRRLERR